MKHRRNTGVEPCIYCGSDSPPRQKREHVFSQALGTYEQNWTLDCVCDECNVYFSRELELPLGRDSIEALLRIDAGVRPAASAESFIGRNMKFTVLGTEHFDGMLARMVPPREGDSLLPDVVPQVGLREAGGDWVYIPEKALTREDLLGWSDKGNVEIKIIAQPQDTPRLRHAGGSLAGPVARRRRSCVDQPRVRCHDRSPSCCCEDRIQLRGEGAWVP